jgi:hypothetical protein
MALAAAGYPGRRGRHPVRLAAVPTPGQPACHGLIIPALACQQFVTADDDDIGHAGRGADMDWDQAIAYTLTQTTQALSELEPQTQP